MPGKPDMTGWHDVDITDWHWFAERDELNEFEMPKELKAKINATQKKRKRESRQDRNATKRKAIEADVFFVPATFGDVQHLIKVGAALDRVQRACDKLGRGDKLTKALRDTLTEIQYDLELEGKLTTWASWWLNARKRQQLLRVDDTLRARRERALAAWDDLISVGWPTHDKRFKAAQPREDLELDDADLDKWRRTLTEQPEPWDPQPPPPPPPPKHWQAQPRPVHSVTTKLDPFTSHDDLGFNPRGIQGDWDLKRMLPGWTPKQLAERFEGEYIPEHRIPPGQPHAGGIHCERFIYWRQHQKLKQRPQPFQGVRFKLKVVTHCACCGNELSNQCRDVGCRLRCRSEGGQRHTTFVCRKCTPGRWVSPPNDSVLSRRVVFSYTYRFKPVEGCRCDGRYVCQSAVSHLGDSGSDSE